MAARRILGRLPLPLLRTLAPRVNVPILPTTAQYGLLTNAPRMQGHSRQPHSRMFTHFSARLAEPTPDPRTSLPPDATLSQKLKHLIKSYGWYALGVYVILSALDFGVAFATVNLIGAEHVGKVAKQAKELTASLFTKPLEPGLEPADGLEKEEEKGGQEGLYAMLVLAYTIHKTLFLPVRVGLTAGFTPKLVGYLSSRGWAGGAGTRRAAEEMRESLRTRRERKAARKQQKKNSV